MNRPVYDLTNRRGERVFAWLVNVETHKFFGGFEARLNMKAIATGKLYTEIVPIFAGESVKETLDKWLQAHLATEAPPF